LMPGDNTETIAQNAAIQFPKVVLSMARISRDYPRQLFN
jgi:hypothetical protein